MSHAAGPASLPRCLLVLLTATASAGGVVAPLLPGLLDFGRAVGNGSVARDPFDEVLVVVCQVAIAGCATWLWLATAVVAVDAVRGRPSRRRGVPGALRRIVLAGCGVALVGGLGAPAHAGAGGETPSLQGLPLPDRAATTTHVSQVFARAASRQERAATHARPAATVVAVQPGDTLWDLARAGLPPHAHADDVARRVREIHHANRSVIGTDPDLIRPGQRLRLPRPTPREEDR